MVVLSTTRSANRPHDAANPSRARIRPSTVASTASAMSAITAGTSRLPLLEPVASSTTRARIGSASFAATPQRWVITANSTNAARV
jgi:hypothetical protein